MKTTPALLLLLIAITACTGSTNETVNLPGITIKGGKQKSIEATGTVCLTNGILEFVAVERGGRDYESIFALDCKPSALKFALILIGCEPGETNGTRLLMDIEWKQNNKTHRQPVEKFLIGRSETNTVVATNLTWMFTGSHFATNPITGKQVFQADEEQAFIALWMQHAVLINLSTQHGNPYQGADQGFEVNSATIPPLDTPVKLVIRPRAK
jgi:hypothetical protein